MGIISPRKVRKLCLPLACLVLLLVVFINFDFDHNVKKRGHSKKKPLRHVVDKRDSEDLVPSFFERNRVAWTGSSGIPQTKIRRHVPGWTMYDNLYVHKGTFYIISNSSEHMPAIRMMVSAGKPIRNEPQDELRREPTGRHMQILSPAKAQKALGTFAKRVEGTTFIVNEAPQHFSNVFNFLAEIMFGLWRTYSSIDLEISPDGKTELEAPRRLILPNIIDFHWRDKGMINPRLLHLAFPSTHVQTAEDWQDFTDLEMPHLYDRVILADRAAAIRIEDYYIDNHFAALTGRFISSPHWWVPIRNILHDISGSTITAKEVQDRTPVITYLSRQGYGVRSLKPEDHDELVRELSKLEGAYGYEIHVYRSDDLSLEDQVTIAARSTILIGVHNEVLLPLLWMFPTQRSAVIELFHDLDTTQNYAWNANALGIAAYAFYGTNKAFRYPTRPASVPMSAGTPITVDGDAVAALCVDILTHG